jgi:hypothetical protein
VVEDDDAVGLQRRFQEGFHGRIIETESGGTIP